MLLFLPDLLNDSQMIRSTIHWVTRICGDWVVIGKP